MNLIKKRKEKSSGTITVREDRELKVSELTTDFVYVNGSKETTITILKDTASLLSPKTFVQLGDGQLFIKYQPGIEGQNGKTKGKGGSLTLISPETDKWIAIPNYLGEVDTSNCDTTKSGTDVNSSTDGWEVFGPTNFMLQSNFTHKSENAFEIICNEEYSESYVQRTFKVKPGAYYRISYDAQQSPTKSLWQHLKIYGLAHVSCQFDAIPTACDGHTYGWEHVELLEKAEKDEIKLKFEISRRKDRGLGRRLLVDNIQIVEVENPNLKLK